MSLGILILGIWSAMCVCSGGVTSTPSHLRATPTAPESEGVAAYASTHIPPNTRVVLFKGLCHCHWRADCPVLRQTLMLKKFVPFTSTYGEVQRHPQFPWGKVFFCGACENLCVDEATGH
ncbi:MAG: hypothetical protein JO316_19175 [Abitibacteriaceae bacterium]|nr:hypothetical protein [Abditibacteriaceae bacterium]